MFHGLWRTFLIAWLISYMGLGPCISWAQDSASATPSPVDASTAFGSDYSVTADAEGTATGAEFKMKSANGVDIGAHVINYILYFASILIGWAFIKGCGFKSSWPSIYVFLAGGVVAMVAEIIVMLAYKFKIKDIQEKYGEKFKITYANEIKIDASAVNYAKQVDALLAARSMNELTLEAVKTKKIIAKIVGGVYSLALVIHLLEQLFSKTPAGASAGVVKNAQSATEVSACGAKQDASTRTQKSEPDAYSPNADLRGPPTAEINSFMRNSVNKLLSYFNIFPQSLAVTSEAPGTSSSTSSPDITKHDIDSGDVSDSSDSADDAGEIESSGPASTNEMFGDSREHQKIMNFTSIGSIIVSFGFSIGLVAILKNAGKSIVGALANPTARTLLYGGASAAAWGVVGLLTKEAATIEERINQYNAIINELNKLQGGSSSDTSTQTLTGRIVDPALMGGGSASTAVCVDQSMSVDASCSCAVNNSCYSVSIPESSFSGFQMPDFGMSALQSATGAVSSISAGNLEGADAAAGTLSDAATRALAMADSMMAQSDAFPKGLSTKDLIEAGRRQQAANIKAILASAPGGSPAINFGDLSWSKNIPSDPKKAVEEMTKVLEDVKKKEENPETDPLAGFDFGFGKKGTSGIHSGAVVKVDEAKTLGGLDVKYNDIHGDDRNIFDVLSNRYLHSYPKLLDEKK